MKKTIYSLVAGRILLIAILLTGSSFSESGTGAFAQGIYSRNKAAASENNEAGNENSGQNNSSDGSLFRASGTENETAGGNQSKITPLTDGWEILLIAGIGYGFCIARRKKN